jgi:hypothetical protein
MMTSFIRKPAQLLAGSGSLQASDAMVSALSCLKMEAGIARVVDVRARERVRRLERIVGDVLV